jgi:putative transcription factor
MNDCEICGRPMAKVYVVEIEGAQMSVCEACAKGKNPLQIIDTRKPQHQPQHRAAERVEGEEEMVEGYGKKLREARDRMGLPLKVLAERIAEKESTLFRVENEKMLPSQVLVKKLERELDIRLTEKSAAENKKHISGKNEPLTLGDTMITKKGKK